MCTLNIVLGRGGGGWKRSCSSAHTKALNLNRLSSEAIVLGRGGGGTKAFMFLCAHKSTAPWSPVIGSSAPWKYVISTYLNDLPTLIQLLQCSARTAARVRARVLQLPDETSYCCTHAVATYKCCAYALLLVRVRASKSSSLRVGNKSCGSCSCTYACETYDLLWYNKSKYIAKCKINSCNACMTSARTWTTAP